MPALTRRAALRTAAVAGTVGVAGCSALDARTDPNERPPESIDGGRSTPDDEWRLPAANRRNAARAALRVPDAPTEAWYGPPPGGVRARRVVAATRDVVVSVAERDEGTVVCAHDAVDGGVRWRRRREEDYLRVGGLVDGALVVGSRARELLALDATDGATRWRVDLRGRLVDEVPGRFRPDADRRRGWPVTHLATPGTVYVGSGYGLHGLDPDDGGERWRVHLGGGTASGSGDGDRTPEPLGRPGGLALWRDRAYASYGTPRATLFAVGANDGEPAASAVEPPTRHYGRPVAAAGDDDDAVALTDAAVFSTNFDGPLASGIDGGSLAWTFAGLAPQHVPAHLSSLATDGERLFVRRAAAVEGTVRLGTVALRASRGTLAWVRRRSTGRFDADRGFHERVALPDPVVAGDTLLVGRAVDRASRGLDGGVLRGLATRTGEERWRVDARVAPASLAVAGGRIFVGGARGGLAAYAR